jgi:hypothetical protein
VLGWGSYSHASLQVPEHLQQDVELHGGSSFDVFYAQLHHVQAILLYFRDSEAYVRCKFTSSVTSSLAVATPVVMPRDMLQAYSFLGEEHVFVQERGEPGSAAMERVLGMPLEQQVAKKARLVELRDELNARSAGVLEELIGYAAVQGALESSRLGQQVVLQRQWRSL